MRIRLLILLVLLSTVLVSAQDKSGAEVDFDHLEIDSRLNVVRTTHAAPYRMVIKPSFKFLGEFHHQAVYNGKGFDISMAVFRRGGDLLLIHAEKHTDGSGGLDYSDLEPAKLDGIPFTRRTQCATKEDEEELKSNPQISFIGSKGFEFGYPFQLEQFFTTSKDGTSEIVISYGRAVDECSGKTGAELRKSLDDGTLIREPEFDPDSKEHYPN